MRKKLMLSMLVTLVFSMLITTLLFVIIENREYIENLKQTLKLNNQIIIDVIQYRLPENKDDFPIKKFKDNIIRETLIDKHGKVLSDSVASKERWEIIIPGGK